ncbi:hypothetical protein G7067_01790 [Leucobacter insecticola]|uniref:Transcription factor zinc-finger domain-containing protein n=1 Tax=Leucobacter insecticola TaxID=2714934 RepID=A0A6G8FGM3_9MICO|nr:zf-TFIIB domain-containing protein [Leucobacter insecticola]QIM15423.1 hypothetical protein G7067_01790 [Leucobacter insecticola]
MNCPTDGTTLLMSERQGIEIDYCPECRGVWLDRGELDKMLERAQAESEGMPRSTPEPPRQQQRPQPRYDEPRYDGRGYGSQQGSYRKKKSPFEFLGDIFEG